MRRLKAILVVMLVAAMVLGTVPVAFASGAFDDVAGTKYADAVNALAGLSKDGKAVITGDPSGAFRPGDAITRAEVTAILARANGLEGMAQMLKGATEFSDVPANHWASGYINLAASKGWVNGYPDGRFGPGDSVTFQQWVTMLVRALGFEDQAVANGGYPTGYEMVAFDLGLTAGTDYVGAAPAPRGEVALMAYTAVFEATPAGESDTLAQSVFGVAPAVAGITIEASAAEVALNTKVEFTATVVDEDGNAVDADVVWSSDLGIINTAGTFISNEAGTATVTATYGDITETATLVVFGEAYGLALAGPAQVVANTASEYEVVVQVVDENGNPVPAEDITVSLGFDVPNGAVAILDGSGDTDETGQVSLTVQATALADRVDTLEATAVDLEAGTLDIASVVQVATAIEVTAATDKLAVNAGGSTSVTAQVVDQEGEPMLQDIYQLTFSMAGVGNWDATGDQTDIDTWVVGSGTATEIIDAIVGETGNIVVTVTGEGLEPGAATIQCLIAGDPYKLVVTAENTEDIVAASLATGNEDTEVVVTVTVTDRRGTPVAAAAAVTIDFTYDTDNLVANIFDADTAMTLEIGDTSEVFYIVGENAGDWAFTVSDADENLLGSGTFAVSIVPDDLAKLIVTPTAALDITSGTPVTIEAAMADQFDNAIETAGTELTFTVNEVALATGAGFVNAADEVTVETDATGVATATFTAQQYAGDSYFVTVSGDGVLAVDTGNFTVVPFLASSITLATKDGGGAGVSSVVANSGENVFVHAVLTDSNGLALPNKDLTFEVISGGGEFVLETVTTDIYGEAVGEFIPGLQGVSVFEVSYEGQVNAVSKTTSVRTYVGSPYKLVAYNGANTGSDGEVTYTADGVYGPYTIKVTDFGGNVVVAQSDITITNLDLDTLLTMTTPTVRTSADGLNLTELSIATGKSSVTFYVVADILVDDTFTPASVVLP